MQDTFSMLTGREIGFFLLLAMTIVLHGCGTREEMIEPKPPSFGAPLVEPLPLRIGYAFDRTIDQEVLDTVGTTERPIARYHLWLGPATRTTFERLFAALFVDALELPEEKVTPGSAPGLDGIIQLRLASAAIAPGETAASATFELIFLSPDSTQEGVWRVAGNSRATESGQQNMELAIREASAKVARDLGGQPAIRSWLE